MTESRATRDAPPIALPLRAEKIGDGWVTVTAENRVVGYCLNEKQAQWLADAANAHQIRTGVQSEIELTDLLERALPLLRGHVHGGEMVKRIEARLGIETPENAAPQEGPMGELREQGRNPVAATSPLSDGDSPAVAATSGNVKGGVALSAERAIYHPTGHDDAKQRLGELVREIEMICDAFGYDPYEWLVAASDDERVPSASGEKNRG